MPVECMLGAVAEGLGGVLPEGPDLSSAASLASLGGTILAVAVGSLLVGTVFAAFSGGRRGRRLNREKRGVYRGRQ